MNRRGFTLLEVLIVIALIGILLVIATFGFSAYSRKSSMTAQTKLLYGDLMEYRIKAFYEKKNWTFKIAATKYEIYSSAATSVGIAPVTTVNLKHTVEFNNATDIVFDSQGVSNVSGKSVCIASANDASVDSVVLSTTRVQIGKKKEGEDCVAAKIDAK
jgi:prepilin-type N-terminal cleavage/methylation domain-containing protein